MDLVIPLVVLVVCLAGTSTLFAQDTPLPPPMAASTQPHTLPARPEINVTVDPRVELMSIVFRLAGNPEYAPRNPPSWYDRETETWFAPFRSHSAVQMARTLRQKQGIGYSAPMSLAVILADTIDLGLLVGVDPSLEWFDPRWQPSDVQQFLALLRSFVRESAFNEFFRRHEAFYRDCIAAANSGIVSRVDTTWFMAYFGGRARDHFHLVVMPLVGGANYGPRRVIGDQHDIYSMSSVPSFGLDGLPVFEPQYVWATVHEFTHSFVNPTVERCYPQLRSPAEKVFAHVAERMTNQGYGSWQPMVYESLVNACVIRYYLLRDANQAQKLSDLLVKRGFYWLPRLTRLLDEYENDRTTYPTLDAFMPRIVEFFNTLAAEPEPAQPR